MLDARFLLVEALGHGGQGRVYRAYDRLARRDVALKVLHGGPADHPAHPLVAEFAVWSRLRHPHVVRAYELGRAQSGPLPRGTPYLVLELVRGLPVHRALRAGGTAPAVIEELARRVLRALDHVHRAGLVHRDLKPGNVLVGPRRRGIGRVKLTDFGLASPSGLSGPPGRISGSIPYVAPETILGFPIDGRADLYALGVLLHYLAAGRLPLVTRSPQRWVRWHLGGPPADPRLARPDLPARLAELVIRLTTRDRDARPSTAAEALSLLGPAPPAACGASASHLPAADRAAIRLAVDAVRRGETREVDLPGPVAVARVAQVELTTLAASLGLASARLTRPVGSRRANLAQIVLSLLMARGREARALVRRHGLERGLPLSMLGGVPVWDRLGHDDDGARRPGSLPRVARGVAAFLLDAARRQTLVLIVERRALADPLAEAVVRLLRSSVPPPPQPGETRGGLLLAMATCARSRCPRTRST